MRTGLTIGEFATLPHLSVRTLRRYHEAGLLEPATIDPHTGYRYYEAEQIPTAQVIYRLRQLDVPLAEVRSILATDDPGQRADVIMGHLKRLEGELDRTRAAVASLRQLVRPDSTNVQVELRSDPARTVAAVSGHVDLDGAIDWYDSAMAELDAAFPPAERTGPPGGRYANKLFTDGAGA
jgi:DNA-binding transcriptional MerR regulator